MAAGILENDMMFSASGIRPWHNLGKVIEDAVSSEDALRIAQLDWSVEQVPVYAGTKLIEGAFANVRSDTKDALGIITAKYKILQNTEAFAFTDAIMAQKDIPCTYETAGSLFNGKRIWMLVKMPNRTILDDEIENYIFLTNSHDGKSSIKVGITNTRIVCNNTLQLAVQGAKRTWSARHMGSIEGRQREAIETLGLSSAYLDAMEIEAQKMAMKKIDINTFLDQMYPIESDLSKTVLRNLEQRRETILSIHNNKNDIGNLRGTAWGIYNAVADMVSNTAPLRDSKTYETRRFVSFLDGNETLERAQLILAA